MAYQTVLEALGRSKAPLGRKESIEKIENLLGADEEILIATADLIKVVDNESGKSRSKSMVLCLTNQRLIAEGDGISEDYNLESIISAKTGNTASFGTKELVINTKLKTFRLDVLNKKAEERAANFQNLIALHSPRVAEYIEGKKMLLSEPIASIEHVEAHLIVGGREPDKQDIKNFEYLLEHIDEDETIHIIFVGHLEAETTDKSSTWTSNRNRDSSGPITTSAFALTNVRLIYARDAGGVRTVLGRGSYVKSIDLSEIRKVSSYKRLLLGTTVLETITNTIRIHHLEKNNANKITEDIRVFVNKVKTEQRQTAMPVKIVNEAPHMHVTEELRKFKQLELDGIITAEEFEAKKKELMGL
ncbi:MAG: SHOCT domain-containing protein [Oscillospiraceae bacterium]|nr:SHOCT domain-containing protein [Oscillospiraceae bacterium]